MNIYGPDGQIREVIDTSNLEQYNDPACKHPRIIEVEDDMPGVIATKCTSCNVGWLTKEKIKQEK